MPHAGTLFPFGARSAGASTGSRTAGRAPSGARVTMYAPRGATASTVHSRVHGCEDMIDVHERRGDVLGRTEERSCGRRLAEGRTAVGLPSEQVNDVDVGGA
jgi:hypothetical protein